MFGDDDPEDGWDEGDTLEAKLGILGRLFVSVALELAGPHDPDRVAVRVGFGVAAVRRTRTKHDPPPPLEAVLLALFLGFLLLRDELGP